MWRAWDAAQTPSGKPWSSLILLVCLLASPSSPTLLVCLLAFLAPPPASLRLFFSGTRRSCDPHICRQSPASLSCWNENPAKNPSRTAFFSSSSFLSTERVRGGVCAVLLWNCFTPHEISRHQWGSCSHERQRHNYTSRSSGYARAAVLNSSACFSFLASIINPWPPPPFSNPDGPAPSTPHPTPATDDADGREPVLINGVTACCCAILSSRRLLSKPSRPSHMSLPLGVKGWSSPAATAEAPPSPGGFSSMMTTFGASGLSRHTHER